MVLTCSDMMPRLYPRQMISSTIYSGCHCAGLSLPTSPITVLRTCPDDVKSSLIALIVQYEGSRGKPLKPSGASWPAARHCEAAAGRKAATQPVPARTTSWPFLPPIYLLPAEKSFSFLYKTFIDTHKLTWAPEQAVQEQHQRYGPTFIDLAVGPSSLRDIPAVICNVLYKHNLWRNLLHRVPRLDRRPCTAEQIVCQNVYVCPVSCRVVGPSQPPQPHAAHAAPWEAASARAPRRRR